jgi:hypothetical protein
MNKYAFALAGFGFAAGIVLFIVIEPLLTADPKATPAPQLAAMAAKPTTTAPTAAPPLNDPAIQAAKITVAKSLKDPPSAAAIAEGTPIGAAPANLRCTNMSVSNPNPNAYYAFVTVDLDTKKIKMVVNYPGGSTTIDYDVTQVDDQKISALSFYQGVERRLVLDRSRGESPGRSMAGMGGSQIIWAKNNFAIGRGHFHCKHEPCWYVVRKGSTASWVGDHSQTTLWQIDKNLKSETGHGTQKTSACAGRSRIMRRPGRPSTSRSAARARR